MTEPDAEADYPKAEFEYIVIGSGAGGGTVAARLAEAGHRVLLLEAGGDPCDLKGGVRWDQHRNSLPDDYDVPVFHAISTESDPIRWDYWVRHYGDIDRQKADPKYYADYPRGSGNKVDGVLYPRAGALGGCTAHNAQIFIYPHNKDWDDIADATGDPTWKSGNMRKYLERMEDCYQRPVWRLIYKLTGWNPTRHGFSGWLAIEKALPKKAFHDIGLVRTLLKSVKFALGEVPRPWSRFIWFVKGSGDHNDWRLVKKDSIGIRYAPLSTRGHTRNGTREFVLQVIRRHPGNLTLELDALATKIILDDKNRARGVEYQKGARLYEAHHDPSPAPGEILRAYASREVILAGGAFNTPQLLLLSGIGPRADLERFGIPVAVDLPGVGQNLQDRYEVGVVYRMKNDWEILEGTTFARGDAQFARWEKSGKGVYATNGAVLAVIKRSDPSRPLPDLFCFATLGKFRGYEPNYSQTITTDHNYLSWIVLKAHTVNQAGTVTLDPDQPHNPRRRPKINFHYFEEGSDKHELDLESVVDGVEFVRAAASQIKDMIDSEEAPGPAATTRADLRQFVKDNAWGHHASCTCRIGPRCDKFAVLDSNFRVYGTQGLRVVDASVFPRIPGFFIVSSVYMIGEKAADAILRDAGFGPPPSAWRHVWSVVRRWLARIWRWLWRVLAIVVLAIVLIAAFSYFFYEPYSKPRSDREVITDIVGLLRGKLLAQYAGTEALRDTHPKANACVRADFTIEKGLKDLFNSDKVKRLDTGDIGDIGLFANAGKRFTAWLRFSNAADVVTPDYEPDFRGLAIKVVGVNGERFDVPAPDYVPPVPQFARNDPKLAYLFDDDDEEKHTQDFLFIAHNAFFAGNAQHFHDFFEANVRGGGGNSMNPFVLWHFLTHPHGFWNTFRGRQVFDSIAEIRWFSVAPFKLGSSAVKYGVFPCEAHAAVPPNIDRSAPNYLKAGLRDLLDPRWHKTGDGLCLNFNVQFRAKESQPIDTTLAAWDSQTASPWHKVASINIYPQEFASPEETEFCQNITFNPWHSLKAHEPIGGINIARRDVMFALQKERLHVNDRQRFEPTGEEYFYPGATFPWRDPPPY